MLIYLLLSIAALASSTVESGITSALSVVRPGDEIFAGGLAGRIFDNFKENINPEEVNEACAHGQLELVEFAYKRSGLLPDTNAVVDAALNGHLDVLKFAYERGVRVPEDTVYLAAAQDRVKIEFYLRDEKWKEFVKSASDAVSQRGQSKTDVDLFSIFDIDSLQNGSLDDLNQKIRHVTELHRLESALPLLMFTPNFSSGNMINDIKQAVEQNLFGLLKCFLVKANEITDEKDRTWFLAKSFKSPWYDEQYWMLHWTKARFGVPDLVPSVFASNNTVLFEHLYLKSLPRKAICYDQFPDFNTSLDSVYEFDSWEALEFFRLRGLISNSRLSNMITEFIKNNCLRCVQGLLKLDIVVPYARSFFSEAFLKLASKGNMEMIYLLEKDCRSKGLKLPPVGTTGPIPSTVYCSAMECQLEALEFFLELHSCGIDRYNSFKYVTDPVDVAAEKGKAKMVEFWWNKFGWLPNKLSLTKALFSGHMEVMKVGYNLYKAVYNAPEVWWIPYIDDKILRKEFHEPWYLEYLHFRVIELGCSISDMQLEFADLITIKHVHERDGRLPTSLDYAATRGRLDVVKYVYANMQNPVLPAAGSLHLAACNGHFRILDWVYETDPEYTIHSLKHVPQLGDQSTETVSYDVIKFLYKRAGRVPHENEIANACRWGSLEIIRFAHQRSGMLPRTKDLLLAARYGHLEVIKYVYEANKRLPCVEGLDAAAGAGHLEILKYVRSNDNTLVPSLAGLEAAAKKFHFEVVYFIHFITGQIPRYRVLDQLQNHTRKKQLEEFLEILCTQLH